MEPLSLVQIREAVRGDAIEPVDGSTLIRHICTDTRAMLPESLFIAIKGDRFDAHDKLADAAVGGALAALVEHKPANAPTGLLLIRVENTRRAMGLLATQVRKRFTGRIIAVGGSNGKTSTKCLIHAVLQSKLRGTASPKSFNNDVGVPLAIFPADPADNYLVLEIGTNHPGEVQTLSDMSLPDIAVITSIGAEHLEGLGDIEGVRREEASLISGLSATGTLIVNGDDPGILCHVARSRGKTITFGTSRQNNLFATDIECHETGVRFRLNAKRPVFVPMLGKHVASNALAALAVAREMGLSDDEIIAALSTARGPEMRLQVEKVNGMTLLNDAYNANPHSMRAALETIEALPATGRRVAVIGDMRELGPHAEVYHREAGETARRCKVDVLICVGENAQHIADAARAAGMPRRAVRHYSNVAAAAQSVPGALRRGDLVLFKASRSVQLDTVVRAVQESGQKEISQ